MVSSTTCAVAMLMCVRGGSLQLCSSRLTSLRHLPRPTAPSSSSSSSRSTRLPSRRHLFSTTSDDDDTNDADNDTTLPFSERSWSVQPVGYVESPYVKRFNTPKQATISRHDGGALPGRIVLLPGYADCLDGLAGFDFIWVISVMHRNSGFKKKIRPQPRADAAGQPPPLVGLFCSRAPHRPNPLALSALKVTGVDVAGGVIEVIGLDLLDGTPVLDIKPYVPAFDAFPDARAGWMDAIDGGDYLTSRAVGYQEIKSPRGARATRAAERKRQAAGGNQEEEAEEAVADGGKEGPGP